MCPTPAEQMLVELTASSGRNVWEQAAQEGIDHVLLVFQNNPKATVQSLLARPDVQAALQDIGAQGSAALTEELQRIWQDNGGSPASAYLSRLINDAQTNGALYPARVQQAMSASKRDQLDKVLHADRIRAASATAVADTRAKAEADFANLYNDGFRRLKWQANFKNGHLPCKWCRYLNGQTVAIGDNFVDDPTLPVLAIYGDLTRPPRHVNCQCKIVGVK